MFLATNIYVANCSWLYFGTFTTYSSYNLTSLSMNKFAESVLVFICCCTKLTIG